MKLKVTASPNPFSAELVVSMQCSVAVNLVVRLVNSNGIVIRVKGCPIAAGESNVLMKNLMRYATGTYCLEIKLLNGDLLETIQLIKQ